MESFSLDPLIDPELREVMEDLLESIYGEEYLSHTKPTFGCGTG